MKDLIVIIMAGGLGKRMNSELPKVLHLVDKKPMLLILLEKCLMLKPKKIMVVVGKYKNIIETTLNNYISLENIEFINQPEAKGTGDAIKCCRESLMNYNDHKVLVLSGDVPLVSLETMLNAVRDLNKCKIIISKYDNPFGLGRILLKDSKFVRIIEEKDCIEEQKKINLVNTGIYAFNSDILCKYLHLIKNNNSQREYYLTDIIEIIKINENIDIDMFEISSDKKYELIGVNTEQQLLDLNNLYINIKN